MAKQEAPKTIAQLQAWHAASGLPSQDSLHLWIGQPSTQMNAEGVYADGKAFILYRTDSDGSMTVAWQGENEAYAVREMWLKLQGKLSAPAAGQDGTEAERGQKRLKVLAVTLLVSVLLLCAGLTLLWPPMGYYQINGSWYCFYDRWYRYSGSEWQEAELAMSPFEVRSYYRGSDYTADMPEGMDFSETDMI